MQFTMQSALGPLKVHVPIAAKAVMPGMRNFPEVFVSDFDVRGATPDGKGLEATNKVTLSNPSPVIVRMG